MKAQDEMNNLIAFSFLCARHKDPVNMEAKALIDGSTPKNEPAKMSLRCPQCEAETHISILHFKEGKEE